MKTVHGKLVFCDLDNTLVKWSPTPQEEKTQGVPVKGGRVVPIVENIAHLKRHALRGHTIILWSKGGADWAEAVAKALDIDWMIAYAMDKPSWVVDDLPCTEWMPPSFLPSGEK